MNNISYDAVEANEISLEKMNFKVTNLKPKYNKNNAEDVKNEIETQLFNVFKKYAVKH